MAQFGKLLERMAQSVGPADEGVRLPSPAVDLPVGAAVEAPTHNPSIEAQTSGSNPAGGLGFEGLIQALDKRDEELEKEKEMHEAARQISEMERTASATAHINNAHSGIGMGGDDMASWMGFGNGAGQLGGCEDFAALLDFNAFGTESGTLFESAPATQHTHEIPHPHPEPAARTDSFDSFISGAEDTSPLLAQLHSAVSSLITSFGTPDQHPSSTSTELFSQFSSPEEGNLGDMFPPLINPRTFNAASAAEKRRIIEESEAKISWAASSSAIVDNEKREQSAFDNVDLSSLADRGIFSLPLFGGAPAARRASGGSPPATADESASSHSPALQPFGAFMAAQQQQSMSSPRSSFASPVIPAASPQDLFRPPAFMQPVAPPPTFAEELSRAPGSPDDERDELLPLTPRLGGASAAKPYEGGRSTSSASGTPTLKKKKPYEPTGTRSSRPLLDADAPTMVKSYAAPGKTTRKTIPVGFQKKLKLKANESGDAILPEDVDPTEILNEIEEKRRKNCVAARESRRRKMEHLNGLKDEIRGWRSYAEQVEEMLRQAGRGDLLDMLPVQPEAMDLEE